MKVSNRDLPQLGDILGLDSVRIQEIISHYDLDEQHQRLMELWFRNEVNPTSEKLSNSLSALDKRKGSISSWQTESLTSASSTPYTPTSPTGKSVRF